MNPNIQTNKQKTKYHTHMTNFIFCLNYKFLFTLGPSYWNTEQSMSILISPKRCKSVLPNYFFLNIFIYIYTYLSFFIKETCLVPHSPRPPVFQPSVVEQRIAYNSSLHMRSISPQSASSPVISHK